MRGLEVEYVISVCGYHVEAAMHEQGILEKSSLRVRNQNLWPQGRYE